jgi:molecular chaperone DnaJ
MAHFNSTYYEALDVSPKANQTEIKHAYRRLAKLFHPDSNQAIANHDRIAGINEAYEVLSDPERRQVYDRQIGMLPARATSFHRQTRTAVAQSEYRQRRRPGQTADEHSKLWLQTVYRPVNRLLCQILNPLEDQIDQLAADPFDDELMEEFQAYLDDCRDRLMQAQRFFQSFPNPANLAGVASNLYYCLNQTGDGIEELERFTYSYGEHYLHTGQELFRIAQKLKREAQAAIRETG